MNTGTKNNGRDKWVETKNDPDKLNRCRETNRKASAKYRKTKKRSDASKRYYNKHKKKILEYRLLNKEKRKEYDKQYRLENLAKRKEKRKEQYYSNREQNIKKTREWEKNNPEKRRAWFRSWLKTEKGKAISIKKGRKGTSELQPHYLRKILLREGFSKEQIQELPVILDKKKLDILIKRSNKILNQPKNKKT